MCEIDLGTLEEIWNGWKNLPEPLKSNDSIFSLPPVFVKACDKDCKSDAWNTTNNNTYSIDKKYILYIGINNYLKKDSINICEAFECCLNKIEEKDIINNLCKELEKCPKKKKSILNTAYEYLCLRDNFEHYEKAVFNYFENFRNKKNYNDYFGKIKRMTNILYQNKNINTMVFAEIFPFWSKSTDNLEFLIIEWIKFLKGEKTDLIKDLTEFKKTNLGKWFRKIMIYQRKLYKCLIENASEICIVGREKNKEIIKEIYKYILKEVDSSRETIYWLNNKYGKEECYYIGKNPNNGIMDIKEKFKDFYIDEN